METVRRPVLHAAIAIALGALGGCGDSQPLGSDIQGSAPLSVGFRAVRDAAAAKPALAKPVTVEASNGTLVLTDVRMVVDEFKLSVADGACGPGENGPAGLQKGGGHDDDDDDGYHDGGYHYEHDEDDHWLSFEAPPQFMHLPLSETESEQVVIHQEVPAGTYGRLKFEVAHPEEDGALLTAIRQSVPDWPAEAALLVEGTFTPTDSTDAAPFRAFFDGEVKIRMHLDPPLVIEETDPEKEVTITIDPGRWFENVNNTVVDLRQFDYAATGRVFDLEVKIHNGFFKVEID